MAFRLHRSNRAEQLADCLAQIVQRPLGRVLARECIVVQGPGMERWLSAVLATRIGIWANPHFPFPRAAIELVLDAALGQAGEGALLFQPDALTFRIAEALPALRTLPGFDDVQRYLARDRGHERLVAFARKLAASFDQYVVYRPELILDWERGKDTHFQAQLWRAIVGNAEPPHLARRMMQLAARAQEPHFAQPDALPERISLFGLSTIPPSFLRVLGIAARQIDVHMFMLSPARDYWGDLDRSRVHRGDAHGLLADLGKTSRELFDQLIEDDQVEEGDDDLFEAPSRDSLLAGLQADLLELTERGNNEPGKEPPRALLDTDDSLRVHACHSRTRELEVLRDELRDRFERDHSLQASDVVVFAPDIEAYAPAIEAVFSQTANTDKAHLPYRIADRKTQRASEVAGSFLALLDLLDSRVPLSDLLDLLHRPAVRSRLSIEENELDIVQHWLVTAGARWAIDAQHRSSFGQPAFLENSLRFAVDRLLLGYASADSDMSSPFGVLPCHQVEGQQAVLLGRVARFVETIAELTRDFARARSFDDWSETLSRALALVLSGDGERGLEQHMLRAQLAELARSSRVAGFEEPVSLKAVRTLLEDKLDRARVTGGFLAGGITFCEHVPMRAIPFRVVCLLGMDDESFPRTGARSSFDLMADAPKRGDRSVRDDDRQLFLEALLSARDALLISYVGRSAQDDTPRPKSALVEHLLRVVDCHFVPTSGGQTLRLGFEGNASDHVSRTHALHRFDLRYFKPGAVEARGPARERRPDRLFSYDMRALSAARAQLSRRSEPAPFVSRPLPWEPTEGLLSLDDLERFFRHPQRRFLKERLSVVLPRELDTIADREPTRLDTLERYKIGDDMLRELVHLPPAERMRVLSQSGRLPPGMAGKVQLHDIEELVEAVLSAEDAGPALPDRDFELQLTQVTLVGRLDHLHETARVEQLVSTLSTKHKLSAWIRHLVLCATGSSPRRTLLVGKNKDGAQVLELRDVENPLLLLQELTDLYALGMHMPLPYLHKPAQELMDKLGKGNDEESALRSALYKALPAPRGQMPNDADDPHVRQVFSLKQLEDLPNLVASDGQQTLSFREISERVLGPMQQHLSTRSS